MTGPTRKKYYYNCLDSPLGTLGLVATNDGLCEVRSSVRNLQEFTQYLKKAYPEKPRHSPAKLKPFCKQLKDYFSGRITHFDCQLDLEQGTDFQRKVWRTLMKIPYGQTRSYAWLAEAVGKPRAARAVGNANGKNPIPIIVPCHRVIRNNGSLGGYTSGTDKKQLLLSLEAR